MRFLLVMLLVLSPAAFAQTINPTQSIVAFGVRETPTATTDILTIGPSRCGTSQIVFWLWNQLGTQPCNNLRLWATSGTTCGTEPQSGDKEFDSVNALLVSSLRQGQLTINIDELPAFATGTTPCGGSFTKNVEHRICASVPASFQCFGLQNPQTQSASPLRIIYDVEAPPAPILSDVRGVDKGLRVPISTSSDTVEVIPFVRAQGDTEFTGRPRVTLGGAKELLIEGLANGTTYEVKAQAVDGAGNVSVDSELVAGTPLKVLGFWAAYRDAGGQDGGCQTAPGLLVPLVALLAFSRRRRS
ncbi:MAG: hypothetical protein MUC96_26220 [Myxococcaceae bacterium]|jgi:hypothetical protein|nr:hypothetical protein [Myxococcaceae bacterium]